MIDEAEADGTLTPGPHDHRAVVGQHRHRHGDDRPDRGLPDQDRACPRTCRSSGASCSRSSAPRSSSRRAARAPTARCAGRIAAGRRAPRLGVPLPVRQRGQPPGALRDHRPRDLGRLPRDHPLRGRPRHVAAPSWASGTFLKEQNPEVKVLAVEPPSASRSRASATSTRATSRPVYEKWGGPELLDGKRDRAPPRVDRVHPPAGRAVRHLRRHLRRRGPRRCRARWPTEIEAGTIVFVVCDGGWKYLSTGAWTDDIDEVVARAEKIIYF